MDDFTLQQELEALAGNAFVPPEDASKAEPMSQTADRWKQVFGLSYGDAVDRIMEHRLNLARTCISDAHWDMVRGEAEQSGHDRESYEYSLELQKKKALLPDLVPAADDPDGRAVTYLVEMTDDGPLSDVDKVRQAAGMKENPVMVHGISSEEGRPVQLCCINGAEKATLLRWASETAAGFEPTILVDPRSLR